jgi:predicted transcriptional regulator
MRIKTVLFRSEEEKISALDDIAKVQDRDRSDLINEAIDQYLSLYEYHRKLIQRSVDEIASGKAKLISHDDVKKYFANKRKKR